MEKHHVLGGQQMAWNGQRSRVRVQQQGQGEGRSWEITPEPGERGPKWEPNRALNREAPKWVCLVEAGRECIGAVEGSALYELGKEA